MLWINRNAWPQIKPQLEQGGWIDRNGKLWKDVFRIDLPVERKGNPRPYFCHIGKDAIEALKRYLQIRGEPEDIIWEDLNSIPSLVQIMLRIGRRIGIIPAQPKKSFDRSVRYGYNLHEMRDVAKSLWHESGADLLVCDFCMGHSVDQLGYDKVYTLSPDYAVKEFSKALSHLNILSSTQRPEVLIEKERSQDKEIALLREQVEELRKGPEYLGIRAEIISRLASEKFRGNISSQEDIDYTLDKLEQGIMKEFFEKPLKEQDATLDDLEPEHFIRQTEKMIKDAFNYLRKKDFNELLKEVPTPTTHAAKK